MFFFQMGKNGTHSKREAVLMTYALIQRVGLFYGAFNSGKYKSFARYCELYSVAISPLYLPGAKYCTEEKMTNWKGTGRPSVSCTKRWLKWRQLFRSIPLPPDGKYIKRKHNYTYLSPVVYNAVVKVFSGEIPRPRDLHPKVTGWHMTKNDFPNYKKSDGIRASVVHRENTYYREPSKATRDSRFPKYWAWEEKVLPTKIVKGPGNPK